MTKQLYDKVTAAVELLQRGERTALKYQPDKGYLLAFSGGKDSQVIMELARMAGVEFFAVHNLTTIDAPQTVHFIRNCYPDVVIERPERTFFKLCEDSGFLPSRRVRFCCERIKERSGDSTFTVTGVRRTESRNRQRHQEVEIKTRRRHPQFVGGTFDSFEEHQTVEERCIRGRDKLVLNPILDWTEKDVWEFIHDRNLPTNPLYKCFSRVGCVFCPMTTVKNRLQEVEMFPKMAQAFVRMIGRLRQHRRETGKGDNWGSLTDKEVFLHFYICQRSTASIMAEKNQINLFEP